MMQTIRYWLIKLLAGKDLVLLNGNVFGSVRWEPGQRGLIVNNRFHGAREGERMPADLAENDLLDSYLLPAPDDYPTVTPL